MAHFIKRKNGIGVRFVVEINGKKEKINLYEKGWTQEDAEAAMVEYRQKMGFVEDKDITIEGFLIKFYDDYVEGNVGSSTAKRYDEFIGLHIVPGIGNVKLQRIKPAELQGFYTKLIRKGLSASTVVKIHRFLHEAFKYGILWGYLRFNPCDGVKPPSAKKKEMVIPTDEEMKAILEKAKEHMSIFMPVYIASTTGMRWGEILGLQNSTVDMDRQKYIVNYSLNRIDGKLQLKKTKTSSSRGLVPFLPGTDAVLKKYITYKKEQQLKAKKYNEKSEFFIVNKFGDPLNPENTSKWFKKIVRELGLSDKMRFHDLRHYHASWLLRQGVHPKVVQERLRHSSIRITLDTYSHLIPDMQSNIMAGLDCSVFDTGHISDTKPAVFSDTKRRKLYKARFSAIDK